MSNSRVYDFVTRCEEIMVDVEFDGDFEFARYFASIYPQAWGHFRSYAKDMMIQGQTPEFVVQDFAKWLEVLAQYEAEAEAPATRAATTASTSKQTKQAKQSKQTKQTPAPITSARPLALPAPKTRYTPQPVVQHPCHAARTQRRQQWMAARR